MYTELIGDILVKKKDLLESSKSFNSISDTGC